MTDRTRRTRPTEDDRRFVETIVFLRGLYAARGPRDAEASFSLDSVMADAQAALSAGTAATA